MTRASEDARALIARVRTIGATLQDEPFFSSAEWLLLPIAKQEVALRRLEALRDYDEIEAPTSLDALRAARKAGVAIARFYQLVSHWRSHDRSPMSLVPHQKLGMERPTRLAGEKTAKAITAAIRRLVEGDPLIATGRVISTLRKTWRGPGDLPSDTALRVFHERVVRSTDAKPGTLTLNFGGQPQERDVVAERFAETLVLDHVSIRSLVAEEDGLPPTVTLVIDLWSGSPIGATVRTELPSPRGVLLALQDAARRLARGGAGFQPAPGSRMPPRLVLATTFDRSWDALVEGMLGEGCHLVDRRDDALHQGGPSRRLLGMRLGQLKLESRADRSTPFDYDPRFTAVQPLATISRLVDEAIDQMASRRIPPGAWETGTPFDVTRLLDELGDPIPMLVAPKQRARRRASPDEVGKQEISTMIEQLAATRTPGGARQVRVFIDGLVWHLDVEVADATRDAAFLQLAQGAMELSAAHNLPIVVHVNGMGPRRV